MRRYVLTPEIPVIISCVSSPLPLAACLWCMLSTRDRYRLRNNVSGDVTHAILVFLHAVLSSSLSL